MTAFNPEKPFTKEALSRLEAAGIPVLSSLNDNIHRLQSMLGITSDTTRDSDISATLSLWLNPARESTNTAPSWKNLFLVLNAIDLDDLIERIDIYFSGATATEQQSPEIKERKATLAGEGE